MAHNDAPHWFSTKKVNAVDQRMLETAVSGSVTKR